MPEALFLCIDSSDHMRNGDFEPSRIVSTQEACNLLVEARMGRNPENMVGFLTFGGRTCTVRETLTSDVERVAGSISNISVSGPTQFGRGVQVAALALSHATNAHADKRIIVFAGSPISETKDELLQLAKRLRKEDIAVDVVLLGVPEAQVESVRAFVDAVSKNNNSSLTIVPPNGSVLEMLFTSPLLSEDFGGGGGGGGAGGMGMDDAAADPQLAAALRASLEEAQRAAAAAAAAPAAPAAAPATSSGAGPSPQPSAPAAAAAPGAHRQLTEEEELELAIKMSMDEAAQSNEQERQAFEALTGDAAAMEALRKAIEESGGDAAPPAPKDDTKKDDKEKK
jgi:26S proteasome regulatory subunit N10